MGVRTTVSHGFGPFYQADSGILILGSFPSVRSREVSFYYGHPRNRFWRVMASIAGETAPETIAPVEPTASPASSEMPAATAGN